MMEILTFAIAFSIFYLWHGMGITIGYHRLLAHRAFRAQPLFEYFWVAGGYLAFQGSPIWWAAIHRAHHRYSDTDRDPHTPKKGVTYSLLGWLFDTSYLPTLHLATHCKDLLKNQFYRALEPRGGIVHANALNLAINIAYRGLIYWMFGPLVFWANVTASFAVFMIPQMLNVACHLPKLGYKNFAIDDNAVNVWWVGILAMGEGWHNNHHAYPGSSRTGLHPHEFDLSWHVIRAGRALGLVTDVNEPEKMLRVLKPRKRGAVARLRRRRQRSKTSAAA